MLSFYRSQNGENQNNISDVTSISCNEQIEKCVCIYRVQFHLINLISIPVGILFSIIDLKIAIECTGSCTIQLMINIYMIVHAQVALFVRSLLLLHWSYCCSASPIQWQTQFGYSMPKPMMFKDQILRLQQPIVNRNCTIPPLFLLQLIILFILILIFKRRCWNRRHIVPPVK